MYYIVWDYRLVQQWGNRRGQRFMQKSWSVRTSDTRSKVQHAMDWCHFSWCIPPWTKTWIGNLIAHSFAWRLLKADDKIKGGGYEINFHLCFLYPFNRSILDWETLDQFIVVFQQHLRIRQGALSSIVKGYTTNGHFMLRKPDRPCRHSSHLAGTIGRWFTLSSVNALIHEVYQWQDQEHSRSTLLLSLWSSYAHHPSKPFIGVLWLASGKYCSFGFKNRLPTRISLELLLCIRDSDLGSIRLILSPSGAASCKYMFVVWCLHCKRPAHTNFLRRPLVR